MFIANWIGDPQNSILWNDCPGEIGAFIRKIVTSNGRLVPLGVRDDRMTVIGVSEILALIPALLVFRHFVR